MSTRFLHTVALVALSAACAFAQAQTPTQVGRIALAQGQVNISAELGDEANPALVNYPVTSRNQVTTGRGARTEIKIGSTALRLDGDSALDVIELDDDSLRLHLHYGSLTLRVRNPEALRGLELSTPQGTVRMQEAGRMRIDAGRQVDTTVVSVFDGVALLDGGGSRLTLRAGKRAEIVQDDVRTGLAMRDGFDEWGMLRDERDDRSASVRYVTNEMTGYEDLDQYGIWRDDREYGPLWSPRAMPLGWAPYRDGSWTYVQPWGWTWIDNAPWGYAPFHYGRWVMVNQRWCWAPGRLASRPVWSPALVGWVGGSNWSLSFNARGSHRAAPARGWYPLSPRDTYVPTYRVDHDKLRYLNRHAGDVKGDIRGGGRRYDDNQRHGMTVLPHDQFNQRGAVVVRGAPQPVASLSSLLAAPVATAPQAPAAVRQREFDGRRIAPRGERPAAPVVVGSAPVQATAPEPVQTGAGMQRRPGRSLADDMRRHGGEAPSHMPTPAPAFPAAVQSPAAVVTPAPVQVQAPQREERGNRFDRGDMERERRQRDPDTERERRPRGVEAYQQQAPVQQLAPVARPMPQMQVYQAPVQQQAPAPRPMPQMQVQQAPVQQAQQRAPAPMAQPQVQQAPVMRQAPSAVAPAAREAVKEERRREKNDNGNLR
ncbi:MAG: DUF6600 domain-containing protein [Pseudomonadota bacterium]